MASQLGSAITPTGHQAYADLLGTEQQNRAMAQQAFQNQQNMALAQQQMGMQGQQFERGMADVQAQRQHEMMRDQLEFDRARQMTQQKQEFDAAQNEMMRKWSEAQTSKMQSYELKLQQLDAMRQAAREQGEQGKAEQLEAQFLEARKQRSRLAMSLTLAMQLPGKTERQKQALLTQLEQQIGQQANVERQNLKIANDYSSGLISTFDERGRAATVEKFNQFKAAQSGVASPLSPNFSDIEQEFNTGATPGGEWLDLAPVATPLSGLGFETTTQGGALAGPGASSAAMTDVLKNRVLESTLEYLPRMGMKNVNMDAARTLLQRAISGGADKAELAQLAQNAGIPTTTLKYLFKSAGDAYNPSTTNARWMDLNARYTDAVARAGGQMNDIRVQAIAKAMDAFKSQNRILHGVSSLFDATGVEDLDEGINVIRDIGKTGQMSGLAASRLARLGYGTEAARLNQLVADLPGAVDQAKLASLELGNLAEDEETMRSLAPLQMRGAGLAGTNAYLKGLEDLLKEMQ